MKATRIIVSTIGGLLGMSGMVHGYRETLLGNTPTGSLLLVSVGAFSVIPNYLITGIAAMIVGLLAAVWSVGFIQRKNGPHIFILLFILLFLVGGGIAQTVFFTLTWAMSTRINNPLTGWRQVLPEGFRKVLAGLWLWLFCACMALFAVGVEIWLFNFVPGVNDATQKLYICWIFLAVGLGVLLVDIVAVFVHDVERQMDPIIKNNHAITLHK
jgi:hypothetical protein